MKALRFERSLPRYGAARVAGLLSPGGGARVGPLSLVEADEPALPGAGWHRVRPRLAGICGSDLATVDGRSSRYFEPIVSFPFTPGHEVVGTLDDGTRVVIEPVLACAARGITPPCPPCCRGDTGNCERISFGHLRPGLQTGYCADVGGGWSEGFVAHESQLHRVPDDFSDEAAVMIEPTACALHAAVAHAHAPHNAPGYAGSQDTVVVLGAGTLGLCTVAALRRHALPRTLLVTARYPEQRRWAAELGADVVVEPGELRRAVRRVTGSLATRDGDGDLKRLAGGADVVVDCVGSAQSLTDALAVVRPRGRVVLVGMPGQVSVDLTPLWHREISLVGAYAYGAETLPRPPDPPAGAALDGLATSTARPRTFDLAFDVVAAAGLERLVSARYPLDRYREAIEHAAAAGRRGAVKVVFDLRRNRDRDRRRGQGRASGALEASNGAATTTTTTHPAISKEETH